MSLRTRLWLVLAALFLLPVVVGGLILALAVPGASSDRLVGSSRTAANAVVSYLADECRTLGLAVRSPALEASSQGAQEAVAAVVDGQYAEYAALLRTDGTALAEAGRLPAGVTSSGSLPQCSEGEAAGPVLAERVSVDGVPGATQVVVAVDLAGDFIRRLQARSGSDGQVLLLDGSRVVATSTDAATTRAIAATAGGRRSGTFEADGWTVRAEPADPLPYTVLFAVVSGEGLRTQPLLLIVFAAVLAAGLLVGAVSRDLSRPFAELTATAERVAQGDLDAAVPHSEAGEAGRLGSALNHMTDELRRSLGELERSRQELRDSLERIGDTLTATHDLDGLLQVVLDTAHVTIEGRAGVVIYRSGEQAQLVAEQGLYEAGLSAPAVVEPGAGVLGRVLANGTSARGRIGSGTPELEPSADEPGGIDVLAVPLRSMSSVVGVLALYGRMDGRPFDANDEDALATLGSQASIAIENVQLHQEAQRLSTTDPLTGIWNFRYLSMSLAREIERSNRFDRPLAVLMLDLDHFKSVNDQHGHARGDMVLRELAERVQEQIREVDTFARYGGEEFVVVLPETTIEGANQLAERICVAVHREPFRADGEASLDVTVSVGGAAFPHHGSSPATLMRAADKALYVAKAEGRDRWHVPGVPSD